MRVLVTGARGQLGAELCRQWGSEAIGLGRAELDLSRLDGIDAVIAKYAPELVVNCAAYTQVDRAEGEAELCWRINALAVERLAQACRRNGCRFVQISTDYVFGRDITHSTPYREDDPVGPVGTYGRSKAAGEIAALAAPAALVIRTCGLYARTPTGPIKGKNFVETMLCLAAERPKLRVVRDQHCSPSYVPHVAAAIVALSAAAASGTYHVVNKGVTSWSQFATALFEIAGVSTAIEPILAAEYGAPAPRPAYSALSIEKTCRVLGRELPSWREGLAAYFGAPEPTVR